ncbi:MAG: hypothetical protein R6W81_11475 [Bacteroidales bacterium]
MKKLLNIFFVIALMFFAGQKGISQTVPQQRDTLRLQTGQTETTRGEGDQVMQRNQNRQQERAGTADGPKAVKQVRSARPDMSKAQGARPPSVVRPSGSGIPKGMGKPGGAGKRGGR